MTTRRTAIAHGALLRSELRLEAARTGAHGQQIMSFEAMACRLAGGFVAPIDDDALREAIQKSLPAVELGELDAIKELPGMVGAAAETLRKAWRSGLDLQEESCRHPRIASVATLEAAVLECLPAAVLRPMDIVARAEARIEFAETLFGSVRIVGVTELSPCWRTLLHLLARRVPVTWVAGPRPVPVWLDATSVTVERSAPETPEIVCLSAANTRHEAIEAMRWARRLIASGQARPEEIAIAAAIPADYDDEFLALRADANFDVNFVHGVKVATTREGQAAAALADPLLRGASQSRIRRLAALARGLGGLFDALPQGWTKALPIDAPLASPAAWERFIASLGADAWPDGKDHAADLRAILTLIGKGSAGAQEAGERLLGGRPLKIWRKALIAGPAASIDATIESLKQGDRLEGGVSVCWMPASELAAAPRRFVRLLGLNSGRWPRRLTEDRLLADHVIEPFKLDPLPPATADRRDFGTILATTATQVVLSRSRRDGEGRLLGRSPLLQRRADGAPLRRNAVPLHAYSETDRLMARPTEFAETAQAVRGADCWRDWYSSELTPHDGLVRSGHPAVAAILGRVQSASSLRALLRTPLGFLWRYGLHLREPLAGVDPIVLDHPAFGDLVHAVLDRALSALEASGGLALADSEQIARAVDAAADEVAMEWAATQPVPPAIIWQRTLAEAKELSRTGLEYRDVTVADGRSYCETPFGGSERRSDGGLPWNPDISVEIPAAGFRIAGRIDRLDLSANRRTALVRDYKTGRTPKNAIVLDGGRELQRCLYGFAVKALLGADVAVSASLFYLRTRDDLRLEEPDVTMEQLARYLQIARASLLSGAAVKGADTGDKYDDLAFALPANAEAVYLKRKDLAARERLGEATQVWEAA